MQLPRGLQAGRWAGPGPGLPRGPSQGTGQEGHKASPLAPHSGPGVDSGAASPARGRQPTARPPRMGPPSHVLASSESVPSTAHGKFALTAWGTEDTELQPHAAPASPPSPASARGGGHPVQEPGAAGRPEDTRGAGRLGPAPGGVLRPRRPTAATLGGGASPQQPPHLVRSSRAACSGGFPRR